MRLNEVLKGREGNRWFLCLGSKTSLKSTMNVDHDTPNKKYRNNRERAFGGRLVCCFALSGLLFSQLLAYKKDRLRSEKVIIHTNIQIFQVPQILPLLNLNPTCISQRSHPSSSQLQPSRRRSTKLAPHPHQTWSSEA